MPADEARFEEYDVVALTEPRPDVDLDAGVWGTVLRAIDGEYEVEFTEQDGTPIAVRLVPGHVLRLVWAEP